MNLIINYDFFNAIKNVNEDFTLFKVIRNNKVKWTKCYLPIYTFCDMVIYKEDFLKYLPSFLLIDFSILFGAEIALYKILGDTYKNDSEKDLKYLVSMLKNININTSYDLLIQSQCYRIIRNFRLNDKKMPQLIESKYILVPSYDYKDEIVDTSVLQEHVIGSKKYIISIGETKKVLKLAYSNSI